MQKIVVYWRDIPAQVIVKKGRQAAKRELPDRFITAIDACAMRSGLAGTDDYLNAWRRGQPEPAASADFEAEADDALAALDHAYPPARLKALIANAGFEEAANPQGDGAC